MCNGYCFQMKSISVSRACSHARYTDNHIYIAHVRIMYFRYHTSLGEREIEINQIKTIWNVSDEYITKTSSWRTIIISFINVIVRNYNFLFSLRWYKWMKKRHKNEMKNKNNNQIRRKRETSQWMREV